MAPATPQFRMADRILDGRLVERLTELRGEGRSFEDVARLLYAETNGGVDVSGQTLRRWARQLGIPAPEAASA